MKYLKIDANKGFYWDGHEYQEIDRVNRDGILALLKSAEKDDFEMDPYNADLLKNRAHQIIYENIYTKLNQFLKDKDQFKNEVEKLYQDAITKYETEVKDEDVQEVEQLESVSESEEINPEDIPF